MCAWQMLVSGSRSSMRGFPVEQVQNEVDSGAGAGAGAGVVAVEGNHEK